MFHQMCPSCENRFGMYNSCRSLIWTTESHSKRVLAVMFCSSKKSLKKAKQKKTNMHWYSFKVFSQQSFQLMPDKIISFDSFLGLFLSMIHLARKNLMVVNWTYKLTLCTLIPQWFNSYNTFSAQTTAQSGDILKLQFDSYQRVFM